MRDPLKRKDPRKDEKKIEEKGRRLLPRKENRKKAPGEVREREIWFTEK